ncbi:MAG: CHAT domain-containing tetratricopeptide repeat protein [Acidobacteriota bacterium]
MSLFLALLLWAGPAAPMASDTSLGRLAALLDSIPKRWATLPPPAVPVSGLLAEEVLASTTGKQQEESRRWLSRLDATPPAERPALIRAELRERPPREADLWLPGFIVQTQQVEDLDAAAATLVAWMEWAEALGRKDVLLAASASAVNVLRIREGAAVVAPILDAWLALPVAPGTQQGRGSLQQARGTALLRLGESGEALAAYRGARQLFVSIGGRIGQANAWRGEADVLLFQGERRKALDAYRSARRIYLELDYPIGQGNTWKGEADILFLRGENQKALAAYRTARGLFAAGRSLLGQGSSWKGEADVLAFLGESQEALEAYRNARRFFVAIGDELGQGNTSEREATVLFLLGEHRQALASYRDAQRLFQAVGYRLGEASVRKGEADALFRLGEDGEALAAYREARRLCTLNRDRRGEAGAWKGEADVLFLQGEDGEALAAYRQARERFQLAGDDSGLGDTWLGEARLLRQAGDWRRAEEAARAALAQYRGADSLPNQVSAQLFVAEARAYAGDAQAAAESAGAAVRLHSQWRRTWVADRDRVRQDTTISRAYDILVPFRAQQAGQEAEALRLAEEARSRVLLDLLVSGPGRGANVSAVVSETPPLEAAAIRALTSGTAGTGPLLVYYAADREVWGFLVLPGEIVVRKIALSWEELGPEIRGLAHDLANPLYEPLSAARARRLWDLLIAPFAGRIPEGGPLVLVPHRALHELPFEALLDPGGRRLFERWQISVAPSASALAFAARGHRAPAPGDSFVGFSAGRGLILPGPEVAEIAGFFGAGGAGQAMARYGSYRESVARARQVLIATRGVHEEGSGTGTYLEIEPTPELHDNRLTADEIAEVPLSAELVTLAACDTSYGHALLSDERLDLTRSFLIARAAAVLAARWKVPEDAATSRFLADFYRAYRQGGPGGAGLRKDEALTEARRRSRERGDPAQLWAAWVLVGDAR